MSRDVSVEWRGDGEVVITKYADTVEARETVEAIRRAVAFFNKNTDETAEGGYSDQGGEEEDHAELETEPSPRERARRQRQLQERIAETGFQESTKRNTMIHPDLLIEKINKAGLGFAMVKRFVEKAEGDELTENQVTALLLGAWGVEFGKKFQANDSEGRIARAAVAKARDAAWFKPTAVETGERALATTTPSRGEKADPLRERIIRDKAVSSPFLSQEQLAAYADAMVAELERTARGRARPGTMERV
jgi:hypothetical protein